MKDTLAKLIRGEIDPNLERSLVDPSYVAIEPTPISIPSTTPAPEPVNIPALIPAPIPVPIILPSPVVIAPAPEIKPSPSPVVIVPAPVAKPAPSPIVQTPAIPIPEAVKEIEPIVKPIIPPTPIPAPVTSSPSPVKEIQPSPVVKALPVEIPIPEVVKKAPMIPTPQPPPAATPISKPAPITIPAPITVPEVIVKNEPVVTPQVSDSVVQIPPQPQQDKRMEPAPIMSETAPIESPQMPSLKAPTQANTWQIQANELRKAAGVRIRAFTNTIPSKAQRFGHNVQIWVGNAINQIQAWRNAHVD